MLWRSDGVAAGPQGPPGEDMGFIDRLSGDIAYLKGALRILKMTTPIAKNPTRVFPEVVDGLAEKFNDAPALLSDRETFTYRDLAERSRRYSRWALAQGLNKGEAVCLLMPNRPEFMAMWLGITRVGGIAAMLNTNLTGPSLAHCINIVEPKHVIVAAEFAVSFGLARPHLATNAKVWLHGEAASDLPRLDQEIERFSGEPLASSERRALTIEDKALYIYTSGTTGLPKAANINHYRLMLASHGFAGAMGTQASDRMYVCLPMYHTTGGVCAIGSVLLNGGSAFIRERFSAREFWNDVVHHECTLFQYIGELCRYLDPHAGEPGREAAPHPPWLRQRAAARRMAGVPEAFPHPEDSGVLRGDRGQRRDVQFRGQARARSAASPGSSRTVSRPPW